MMDEEVSSKARIGYARRQARELLGRAKILEAPVRLNDVVAIVRQDHTITLLSSGDLPPGISIPSKINAMTVRINSSVTIAYNTLKPLNRQKFSVAHELGHLYMQHVHEGGEDNLSSTNQAEQEANAFAAELVMPLAFLKKDTQKERDIKLLSVKYAVSEEAMGWRLYETGLFKNM